MNNEMTVSVADVEHVMNLIREYLYKGGTGLDSDALERMLEALGEADQITIVED